MKLLLMKEGTWQYVNPQGGNPPVAGEPPAVVAERVKGLHSLFMSVKENVFSNISECTDPIVAWTTLATLYQQNSNAGKLMLKDKLRSMRLLEGASVKEFIRQIQEIQAELRGLGDAIPDVELVERIVNTLPPSFDSVYQNILGLNAMPTFADLIARLLQAETRAQFRGTMNPSREDALAVRMQQLMLPPSNHVGQHVTSSYPRQPSHQYSRGRLLCHFCGGDNHLMRNCPDLAREMARRARDRRGRGGRGRGRSYHPGPGPTNTFQSNVVLEEYIEPPSEEPDLFDVALCSLDLEQADSWIVDSGAAKHVSGSREVFDTLGQASGSSAMQTASGHVLPVEGAGTVNLSTSGEIQMDNVYYVPGLTSNLMSVGCMADKGFILVFDKDQCLVYSGGTNQVVGRGVRDQLTGLYRYILNNPAFRICAVQSPEVGQLWHRRMGHLNPHSLRSMGSKGVAIGVPLISGALAPCTSCYEGKQSRRPAPKEATRRADKPLALIHSDLCGMIQPRSLAGSHYFVTFTDDYSRYTWIFFLQKKSDTLASFQKFKATVELAFPGSFIQAFRSDRGGEFISTAFSDFLQSSGIHRELTQAYTPHQNGVSERKNRTLLEKARSMFLEAHTPRFLWAEAVNTANYLTNRSPTRANGGVSPYQRLYKKPPSLHHLRIFGCVVFVHQPDEYRTKLEPKSRKCLLLGYSEDTKGYRCYDPTTHKIHISNDVHFVEHQFWHTPDASLAPTPLVALEPLSSNSAAIQVFDPVLIPHHAAPSVPVAPELPAAIAPPMPVDPEPPIVTISDSPNPTTPPPLRVYVRRNQMIPPVSSLPAPPALPATPSLPDVSSPILTPHLRRSSRSHVPNSRFLDYVATVTCVTDAVACVHSMGEPRSYSQAANDPNWVAAMRDELCSIHTNKTWTLVPCPPGVKPLHVKWVYKLKTDTAGHPLRYKARLVARGDEQLEGIDFTETFSPVVKWSTMRTVVSMAAMRGWPILHLDVKCAFLNGDLAEQVYVFQPPGFIQSGAEDSVCLLHKALYGLRQSPRQWNARLDAYLLALGLVQSHADPSLYILIEGDLLLLLIIYVDDLLITGSHSTKIQWLAQELNSEFQMSLLGPLAVYLGVSFFYEPAGILMSHTRYIIKCLDELGLTNCLPAAVPLDPSAKLSQDMDSPLLPDPTYYRIIVGKALHLNNTRPDIVFAVGVVTRYTKAPREAHLEAAIHIMRYLKGTMHLAILYRRGEEVTPSGYTDSDFQGDLDERRSTSGYLFNIGSGPTSWRSKLQDEIAESSSEAEYRACAEALKEALWLRNFFEDVGMTLTKPLIIYCDNQSCIALAKNPVQHARTKHLERGCHFTRHQIKQGRIELVYIKSKDQLADINTKALPRPRFLELRDALHLTTLDEVRRRDSLLSL
jgi:hypothetical protein